MSMTQEEINNAIDGVMALRPAGAGSLKSSINKSPALTKRMSDLQFQQEMAAIMANEPAIGSAFFFRNSDESKGGRKNSKWQR